MTAIDEITELRDEYAKNIIDLTEIKDRLQIELTALQAIVNPSEDIQELIEKYQTDISNQCKVIDDKYQTYVNNIDNLVSDLKPGVIVALDTCVWVRECARRVGNVLAKFGADGLNSINLYYMSNAGLTNQQLGVLVSNFALEILTQGYITIPA